MKIGICSARAKTIDPTLDYIGVDHGVEILINQGIKPIYAIGDFDSLKDQTILTNLKIHRLPTRKDVTDTHSAIDYAIANGYDEIDVYGVTGGRLDHFMSAMCLLEKYRQIKIRIIDEQNIIQLINQGIHQVYHDEYRYFSLFALDDSYIDIVGAEYPLTNYHLYRDDPLCVSNQVSHDVATITTSKPIILIKAKDKEINKN